MVGLVNKQNHTITELLQQLQQLQQRANSCEHVSSGLCQRCQKTNCKLTHVTKATLLGSLGTEGPKIHLHLQLITIANENETDLF